MSIAYELAFAVLAGVFILAFAGGVTLFAFVLNPRQRRRALADRFPIEVPGWGTRLSSPPPFNASVADVADALEFLAERANVVKGYSLADIRAVLDVQTFEWVRADNLDGARWVLDDYGRKIGGDHQGRTNRIVYLEDDELEETAFFHEPCHAFQTELERVMDEGHNDVGVWKGIVQWCKREFPARRMRVTPLPDDPLPPPNPKYAGGKAP